MKTLYLIAQVSDSWIYLIVVIVAFFVLREFFLWYWKINKLVAIQQHSLTVLFKIYEKNGGKVDWDEVNKIIYK